MFKKLDILINKSFIGPFVITFFVTLFVLVMIFFYTYMDDLIGKGLGVGLIIQLLLLMSTTMVPLALPLAILLSSIMTFGTMGENFELIAIKASAISLTRFMRPIFITIIGISIGAFLFSNYVIPVANLKSLSLLYDLRNSKPTLNIRAGQFNNTLPGYAIRVGSKDNDGKTIHNIMIYDTKGGRGHTQLILAKSGVMTSSLDKRYLVFQLKDGCRYQDGSSINGMGTNEQTRMYFKVWNKVFDLSTLKLSRTDEDAFKSGHQFMNVGQLANEIDSNFKDQVLTTSRVQTYLSPYISIYDKRDTNFKKRLVRTQKTQDYTNSFISQVPDSLRTIVLQNASANVRSASNMADISATDKNIELDIERKLKTEWHRKFTLSFACIVLFLIGAPLGTIIRKGGIGLPLILAIIFFVLYHIFSKTGEQLVKSGELTPAFGMWMSSLIFVPLAIWLIQKARNDSQVLNKEWYYRIWKKLKKPFSKKMQ